MPIAPTMMKQQSPETPALPDKTRGDNKSYDLYYLRMDATAQIKVAATTPHIEKSGATIVDFGMGTGSTSYDLANLFPNNKIIGIDFDPHSLAHATLHYTSTNLLFQEGDITKVLLPPNSVDVAFYSSIIHELPCYCDPKDRFTFAPISAALDSTATVLKFGGKIIIRDFVAPAVDQEVYLDIISTDGANFGKPKDLNSAALFELFIKDFKSSRFPNGGLANAVLEVESEQAGWRRFKLPHREAAEFVLRRAYADRWDEELKEEYLFWDQKKAQTEISARGFRTTQAQEVHNTWRHEHHFDGKFKISTLDGKALPFPATNFLYVAEKVGFSEGISLVATKVSEFVHANFLKRRDFKQFKGEKVSIYEMVERPNPVIDCVPWFKDNQGSYFVMVRTGYPRALVAKASEDGHLDRSSTAGYVCEPISLDLGQESISASIDRPKFARELRLRTGIQITERSPIYESTFCPSPGGVSELVKSRLVQIDAAPDYSLPVKGSSGFSSSGDIRPIEARQALRAYQIGGMFDSRLEIAIYNLLLNEGISVGPWLGAEAVFARQDQDKLTPTKFEELLSDKNKAFTEVAAAQPPNFLAHKTGVFEEFNSLGLKLSEQVLEFVEPKKHSNSTISILPVVRTESGHFIGLEKRDLPAPQLHFDSSRIPVVPAFRIEKELKTLEDAISSVTQRFSEDFNIKLNSLLPLGGKYHPCPGILPEVVYPFVAEVTLDRLPTNSSSLNWVSLDDLLKNHELIKDGHLLTALFRFAHMVKSIT